MPWQPSFWSDENFRFSTEFTRLLLAIYEAGAMEADANATPAIQLLVDWDAWNTQAVDYVRLHGLELAKGINGRTRQQVLPIIEGWIRSGEPLQTLQDQLQPFFGRRRAEVIASTEVTRAYAAGNVSYWETTGVVVGKQWRTAVDELVCPICGPLHMEIVSFETDFGLTAETIAASPQLKRLVGRGADPARLARRAASLLRNNRSAPGAPAGAYPYPPAHPRCRCWVQPVVSEALIEQRGQALLDDFFSLAERGIVAMAA